MPELEYSFNTFVWTDLSTSDQAAAKEFYSLLFDWTYDDMPVEGGVYSMAVVKGKNVAAIMAQLPEEQGMPPHWNTYISVEDVDDVAKRAGSLGGKLLAEPFDVMDQGRMATVQDPSGAIVSLWQDKTNPEPNLYNEHGTLNWNELVTRDTSAARDFYTQLLGWGTEEMPMGEGAAPYVIWKRGDDPVGGMFPMGDQFPPEVPPYWNVCFAIEDVDARLDKARSAGATVTTGPMDGQFGRYAVMQDPQGAVVAVNEFTPEQK